MEGHNQELHALRNLLAEKSSESDTIFLTTPRYTAYFMNYYKLPAIWYSLPLSPGERYSCEDLIRVDASKADQQVDEQVLGMFQRISRESHRPVVWLVADNGPSVPCATRPVEHYFAENAFTVSATDFSPLVRLDQFVLLPLPPKNNPAHSYRKSIWEPTFTWWDMTSRQISLRENNTTFQAGDLLGVSLVWETAATLQVNYTVAMYLINESGEVVLQQDREPVGGFSPTNTWIPDKRLRDNYGFVLPESLPPGNYQLWVVIYSWPSLERLPVTGPDGIANGDHVVLTTITVH